MTRRTSLTIAVAMVALMFALRPAWADTLPSEGLRAPAKASPLKGRVLQRSIESAHLGSCAESARRADRAVFGFSSGGVFATYAGMEHGREFAHALAFSLGVGVARPSGHRALPEFHFAAGKLEPGFAGVTREMHGLVKELGARSTFKDYTSGHDMLMWQVALAGYLPRVFPPKR